ncbi:hypothetical protein LTR70_003792 [Exophiala xenobiotica]|uniref:Heterokaryon incompatibility domain-containing protein n=1 Tax=Lithohypha guttulata TaxID=1690604 RepID=A0ABR0KFF0_9EURO|nr:hypothetical protein LTR24_003341 [Lithohypha guttulata]KAK5322291.1 hypothetical protein LTR70_003792 [Exophiala xenobiotica]
MPAPDQSSFYQPLRTPECIRLLRRAGVCEGEDDIPQFWLEEYNVAACPAFVAVSYTWSPPYFRHESDSSENVDLQFTSKIGIDCKPYAATQNMVDALQCVLVQSTVDHVWMDGCCINQASQSERTLQVSMMHKIYEAANLVIVWLGGKHPQASGFQWITNEFTKLTMNAANDRGYKLVREASPQGVAVLAGIGPEEFDCILKDAMQYYQSCRFFERTWVRQEVVLARQVRMFCGDLEISFEGLGLIRSIENLLWPLHHKAFPRRQEGRRGGIFGGFGMWFEVHRSYHEGMAGVVFRTFASQTHPYVQGLGETSASFLGLWLIISRLQSTACSDPRDKIYAVWRKSPYQSLHCANVSAIGREENTGCLTLLAHVCVRSDRQIQLPSWVPDFSARYSPTLAERFNGRDYQAEVHATGLRRNIRFAAGKLISFGTPFAIISKMTMHDWARREPDGFLSLFELIADVPGLINGVPRIEALWRTLVHDSICINQNPSEDSGKVAHPAPADVANDFHHWTMNGFAGIVGSSLKQGKALESIVQWLQPLLGKFRSEQKHHAPWIVQILLTHQLLTAPETDHSDFSFQTSQLIRNGDSTFSRMTCMAEAPGRPLFMTEEGFIGNAPQGAQPGDQVWFVTSCSVPLLFRPAHEDGTYTLIGCCYLHGFMHGTKMFDPEYDFVNRWRRFTLV